MSTDYHYNFFLSIFESDQQQQCDDEVAAIKKIDTKKQQRNLTY